jgi:peptidoglycan L-alanyl-D-glutamate endopeptidase CwlK
MYSLGKTSRRRLDTCDDKIIQLIEAAISDSKCPFDFLVVCGARSKKEQDAAFNSHNSMVKWPDSYHNKQPSQAVDVARYYPNSPHIRWREESDFDELIKHIKKVAKRLKIKIECGIDWETFKDSPHIQLAEVIDE